MLLAQSEPSQSPTNTRARSYARYGHRQGHAWKAPFWPTSWPRSSRERRARSAVTHSQCGMPTTTSVRSVNKPVADNKTHAGRSRTPPRRQIIIPPVIPALAGRAWPPVPVAIHRPARHPKLPTGRKERPADQRTHALTLCKTTGLDAAHHNQTVPAVRRLQLAGATGFPLDGYQAHPACWPRNRLGQLIWEGFCEPDMPSMTGLDSRRERLESRAWR